MTTEAPIMLDNFRLLHPPSWYAQATSLMDPQCVVIPVYYIGRDNELDFVFKNQNIYCGYYNPSYTVHLKVLRRYPFTYEGMLDYCHKVHAECYHEEIMKWFETIRCLHQL
jgi:hypothetical protein